MNWVKTEADVLEAENYTIKRVKHYYYELTHKTDGAIRKYRTLIGAQRAAERRSKDNRPYPKHKTPERQLKAALEFQAPERKADDRDNDTSTILDKSRDSNTKRMLAKGRSQSMYRAYTNAR